jgi:hypothetical protein
VATNSPSTIPSATGRLRRYDVRVTILCRSHQGCLAHHVLHIKLGSRIQQVLHDIAMAVLGR